MANEHNNSHPDATAPDAKSAPLISARQSAFYLQAKSNWHQRWQAVIEQCSDCFIRY